MVNKSRNANCKKKNNVNTYMIVCTYSNYLVFLKIYLLSILFFIYLLIEAATVFCSDNAAYAYNCKYNKKISNVVIINLFYKCITLFLHSFTFITITCFLCITICLIYTIIFLIFVCYLLYLTFNNLQAYQYKIHR